MNVFGMFDGGESVPLAGEEKTTLKDDPDTSYLPPTGKVIIFFCVVKFNK